jgi:lipopolysaccharide export system permease protein
MKKLIFKKFISDTSLFFFLTLISFAIIVWVIQAVNFLDFVTEDGHAFQVYFYYILLTLPKIFSRILPFVFFISLLYALTKIDENNELLIFWTVGINKSEFKNNIIKFTIVTMFIQHFFSIYLVPKTQDLARSFIRTSSIDFFPSLIKEKKFIDTVSKLTIFVETKNSENELINIFLKDEINVNQSQIIYAKKGNLINKNNKNYIVLLDGKILKINKNEIVGFNFKETMFDLSKYQTKSTTFPKFQEINSNILINCFLNLLTKKTEEYKSYYLLCNDGAMPNVSAELFKRFFLPLYLPLIGMIACLLILKTKDDFNYKRFQIIVFLLGVVVISFSEISIRFVNANFVNNIIFSLIPVVLFLLVHFFFLYKTKFKIS